jgi:hypothetical protein
MEWFVARRATFLKAETQTAATGYTAYRIFSPTSGPVAPAIESHRFIEFANQQSADVW